MFALEHGDLGVEELRNDLENVMDEPSSLIQQHILDKTATIIEHHISTLQGQFHIIFTKHTHINFLTYLHDWKRYIKLN